MKDYQYLLVNLKTSLKKEIDIKTVILDRYFFLSKIWEENNISYIISRRSIDARKKNQLFYNFSVILSSNKPLKLQDAYEYNGVDKEELPSIKIKDKHPFIIGMGPAGLFSALELVEKGFKPYIFDRGDSVEERSKKVELFWKNGKLDEESNVQYGEGGAGTFSDGKLTARGKNLYSQKVFEYLIRFGANPSIQIDSLPHLGTNGLKIILKNIREYLESKGCCFHFNHHLESITLNNQRVEKVRINGKDYHPELIIFGPGNSARDSFEMLHKQGIALESKPFAVGFRIEHLQSMINESFYGKQTDFSLTGPATYNLTAKSGQYGVYTFCMCPGGMVIPASSIAGHQVVNGMSYLERDNQYANSAVVVTVSERDFGTGLFDGVKLQEQIERKSFRNYSAPIQNASDYIINKVSKRTFETSYSLGTTSEDLNSLFPNQLNHALKEGLLHFEKRVPNFCQRGLLIAPETRTSSPIRIVRDQNFRYSITANNLFPVGEGSGYAGGIISSASDGLKTAMLFYLPDQRKT